MKTRLTVSRAVEAMKAKPAHHDAPASKAQPAAKEHAEAGGPSPKVAAKPEGK